MLIKPLALNPFPGQTQEYFAISGHSGLSAPSQIHGLIPMAGLNGLPFTWSLKCQALGFFGSLHSWNVLGAHPLIKPINVEFLRWENKVSSFSRLFQPNLVCTLRNNKKRYAMTEDTASAFHGKQFPVFPTGADHSGHVQSRLAKHSISCRQNKVKPG